MSGTPREADPATDDVTSPLIRTTTDRPTTDDGDASASTGATQSASTGNGAETSSAADNGNGATDAKTTSEGQGTSEGQATPQQQQPQETPHTADDHPVASNTDDDDGWFPCYMCGHSCEELEGLQQHVEHCERAYHLALDNLARHPLCGLVSRNTAPEMPNWALARDDNELRRWRSYYKRALYREFATSTILCRGCDVRFRQAEIGQHFDVCTCAATASVPGCPLVVHFTPNRTRVAA